MLNTLEDFNKRDKRELIIDAGKNIWESITDESRKKEVDSNLELYLSRFLMIVFADLKRYSYHYWCAFPALNYPSSCFQLGTQTDTLDQHFTSEQVFFLLYFVCIFILFFLFKHSLPQFCQSTLN